MKEMDIKDLEDKIDHASILMYQNHENDAMKEMSELFPYLDEIINDNLIKFDSKVARFSISTMKELIDAYKNADMLCMADCLQEKILLIVELFNTVIEA